MEIKLRLASNSPRRKELIKYLNMPHTVLAKETRETAFSKDPEIAACEISAEKARASIAEKPLDENEVVIGADTTVCIQGNVLGKPKDRDDAARMISMLSGKTHNVVTGITLIFKTTQGSVREISFAEVTKVCVANLSDDEINAYLDLDEYSDKAGSYAIQGPFSRHIEKIDGDYNNVVGFPVARIYKELKILYQTKLCDILNV